MRRWTSVIEKLLYCSVRTPFRLTGIVVPLLNTKVFDKQYFSDYLKIKGRMINRDGLLDGWPPHD
jgi:hypothetical protein